MNIVAVWFWWIITVAFLVTLLVLWGLKMIPVNIACVCLVVVIIMVILGVVWFSSWGDTNNSTVQPGTTVWYVSNETRTSTLDSSTVTIKTMNANNNSQISNLTMGVNGTTVTSNNIQYTTTATSKYVVRVDNSSGNPINLTLTSSTLTFSGPSSTAP